MYSNKKLGQHFIKDSNLHKKIVQTAGSLEGFDVLEIGPGYGGLTREIMVAGPRNFIALEKDRSFAPHYDDCFADQIQCFMLGDALDIDERKILLRPAKIIANLPYNISSQLIFKWLDYINFFTSITIMLQKEFALRISCAEPGSKSYGRLSILVHLLCDVRYEFTVGPGFFTPPPKVDSAVVNIVPLAEPRFSYDEYQLNKFTKFAFNNRRKQIYGTLRNYLKEDDAKAEGILCRVGIDKMARPDSMSVEQHCKLSLALKEIEA